MGSPEGSVDFVPDPGPDEPWPGPELGLKGFEPPEST